MATGMTVNEPNRGQFEHKRPSRFKPPQTVPSLVGWWWESVGDFGYCYGNFSAGQTLFMKTKEKFGIAVRERRKELEMSQKDLGVRIGLDQGYVSRIEQGKMNITLDTMEEICKVLDVRVRDIFG
jgi:DNA-binding Xre family transcriptional regulator